MPRGLFFFALALTLFSSRVLPAQDEGPPISITSPDTATTFTYGTVKDHTLVWNKNKKVLIARVTFTDADQNPSQSNDDTHEFRLPGISFDEATGVFVATTANGEIIPVAHFTKVLFMKTIETTRNAVVRILHPRGHVTVILEAISPNDPAMHPDQASPDPDATH